MNSYLTYYLGWIFLSYALRTPWLLLGLAVLLVLRRWIPGPGALMRGLGRARGLRTQVELNRANITARRDLAEIYLDGVRAKPAVKLLEEGLALSPNDPELLYLFGLALHRVGRHEEALPALVRSVELDPGVRYGQPYAVAGDALAALKRWDEALDAYEHYVDHNSSDVSGYTRLARAQARCADRAAARETLREGLRTWGMLHGGMRNQQFGHYLKAHLARATVLGEPSAIALLLVLSVLFAGAVHLAYAPVLNLFSDSTPVAGRGAERRALFDGFHRCGSQNTGDFFGSYMVLPNEVKLSPAASAAERDAQDQIARFDRDRYANFQVQSDRIVSGTTLVEEVCLTRVLERTPTSLRAEAVWHEDVADPGDASMVIVKLEQRDGVTTMKMWALGEPEGGQAFRLTLKRKN